jgi:Protein of unknown function (DUF2384)
MLDDESQSLKALSIALDRLQEPPDEQTQKKLNQAVKDLRLAIRECSPLLDTYNEALDQLQDTTESQPRNKFINLSAQSARDKITQKTPLEILEENGLVGCFEGGVDLKDLHQSDLDNYLDQNQNQQLSRINTIYKHAAEVFENSDIAWKWLQRSNRALGGAVPLQLLETESGTEQVAAVLNRIEYGGYS